jgi:hypothetical protein
LPRGNSGAAPVPWSAEEPGREDKRGLGDPIDPIDPIDLIDPIDPIDLADLIVNKVNKVNKVNEVPKRDALLPLQSGMISFVPGVILLASLIVCGLAARIFRHLSAEP